MVKVMMAKEIVLTVPNKVGVMAKISKALADKGVNIEGVAGYAKSDAEAEVMIVVNRAVAGLDKLDLGGRVSMKERDMLLLEVENKPGALKEVFEKLAAGGVDIRYLYGTACASGCPSRLVLSTGDNQKALGILKK
ncbi:MAG: ACT domain-containing protein [Candidatus Omnitrophica bacterium]|nr:ACT domain-containing protein [Candidatus Omnitrophota bacterium]